MGCDSQKLPGEEDRIEQRLLPEFIIVFSQTLILVSSFVNSKLVYR
jgi:hypothetical protein